MSFDRSDIHLLLAAPQAAGGYTTPGSVYNSNGRWASTTQINADVPLDNLFPDLTGPQNAASQVDYQCLFVYNSSPNTITNVYAWIPASSVVGAVEWAVGADTTLASDYNETVSVQAGYIAIPTLAPTTVGTFYGPAAQASSGAPMGSIDPGKVAAVWVRRTAVNSPAFNGALFNLQVTFDVVAAS